MAADLLLGSLVRDSSEVVLHVNHVLGFVLLDGCHICLIADGLGHKLVEYVVLLPQMKWMLLQGLGNLHFLLGLFPDALGSQANQRRRQGRFPGLLLHGVHHRCGGRRDRSVRQQLLGRGPKPTFMPMLMSCRRL